ncbi:hypothetical protein MMC30_008796 [Trapelia coarctata]|nr:hypothetical protein [Trapelia coarctata]
MANSFNRYGISSPGEIAALISLMAYETGDFRYQVNLAGTPGQGTRNMQAARFNILYASSIPALAAQVKAITGGAATGRLSASQLNAVLALLTGNADYDWGSAAWFLTTQCPGVRTGLQSATLASWQNYIQNCIGIAPTGDRQAGWTTAKQALGT